MLTRHRAALIAGALGAAAAITGGGVLIEAQVLRFGVRAPSGAPPSVPAIAVPRTSALRADALPVAPRPRRRHGAHRARVLPGAVWSQTGVGAARGGELDDAAALPAPAFNVPGATVGVPGASSVVVELSGPVLERHPSAPPPSSVVPDGSGAGAQDAPVPVVALPVPAPVADATPDRPGAAGPRLVVSPAELAPPADPLPVVSRADNAPPPVDTAASPPPPDPDPTPTPEPAPVAAEPTLAEPDPPAEPVVAEAPAPAESPAPDEPVPTAPPTPAETAPPADVPPAGTAGTIAGAVPPDAVAQDPAPTDADASDAAAPAAGDASASTA